MISFIFRRDPVVMESRVEQNRENTAVTLVPRLCTTFCATLCLSILQPRTTWTKCSTLLTVVSAKSPGFKKWRPGCLNLNTARALQTQGTCEAISDACLHLSHPGLSTCPSLNRCPFKWQCPVSNPVIILSLFLLQLSNFPALSTQGLLRNPLACLCPRKDYEYSSCFLLLHHLITPRQTL